MMRLVAVLVVLYALTVACACALPVSEVKARMEPGPIALEVDADDLPLNHP
jgi:hypothetical protein